MHIRADRTKRRSAGALGAILPILLAAGASAQPTTTRVSVSSNGTQGNNFTNEDHPNDISADGRFVAFESDFSTLVPNDTNGRPDIFVHDRRTGQMTRVSVSSIGEQGNHFSHAPSISADGRYVAFTSFASNLVPDDSGATDVFVHDRQTGQTTRVSRGFDVPQANNHSDTVSISADGRFVAFASQASNIVPGDMNGWADVFLFDRQQGSTSRISVSSAGVEGNSVSSANSVSGDGRFVAFSSFATNLVPGDKNETWDIFVRDTQSGQTTRANVSSSGVEANFTCQSPAISANGRFVAFLTDADNLVPDDTNQQADTFVHDLQTGQTMRVSVASDGAQGNSRSAFSQSLSADGRFVAFSSYAGNLVPGVTFGLHVFVHDRHTGQTTLGSPTTSGALENGGSWFCSIADNGRFVAFTSTSSNLVSGDTNGRNDAFVHDRAAPCPGDTNADGTTDFGDLNTALTAFGTCASDPNFLTIADLNGDGCANFLDLNIVLVAFGTACPPWTP